VNNQKITSYDKKILMLLCFLAALPAFGQEIKGRFGKNAAIYAGSLSGLQDHCR
jgi:hypothetical protein